MLYCDIPDGESATFALETPPGAHGIQQTPSAGTWKFLASGVEVE